jgi:RNA polymerase sigma-70 factor, ECF subfamily
MPRRRDPVGGRHEADLELARRCGRGDEAAQRSFVDRFGSLVYSICGRSGIAASDRDDVAQQILLDAYRALSCYQGTSRLSTWIYTLALRRVADHFRSPQRRLVASGWPGDETFPLSTSASSAEAPDEQMVRAETCERLRGAVSRLAEPERAVVLAYYVGEMSVAEISRALNVPEGTVKTRLHRGRQALRKELSAS